MVEEPPRGSYAIKCMYVSMFMCIDFFFYCKPHPHCNLSLTPSPSLPPSPPPLPSCKCTLNLQGVYSVLLEKTVIMSTLQQAYM